MRKSFWIFLALLIMAVGAPVAHADTITDGTITFTLTSGSPDPGNATFVFDNTTNTFTSFTGSWAGLGITFITTGVTLANLPASGTWCATSENGPGNGPCPSQLPEGIGILMISALPTGFIVSHNGSDEGYAASGTYTVTEAVVSTPEPGSVGLMLLGIGLVFVMRRRIGQGPPLAA